MKERLDVLMLKKGLVSSREKAKALIMEGVVYVSNQKEDKPGNRFDEDAQIEVRGKKEPFVSRGGKKLEKAVRVFGIDLTGLICTDVGASTGGFTDCMLQHGASKVYAIDVGYGQLDWGLRNDPRVVVMEKTNIRYVTPDMFDDVIDFSSIDVSFISLEKVLPAVTAYLKSDGKIAALIKPQFEAGRDKVGKKGVVRDPKVHEEVIRRILAIAANCSLTPIGLDYSPIKGPEGNIEYLVYLSKAEADVNPVLPEPEELVKAAFADLNRENQ